MRAATFITLMLAGCSGTTTRQATITTTTTTATTAAGPALSVRWVSGWAGQILYLPLQSAAAGGVEAVVFRTAEGREVVVRDVRAVGATTVAILAPVDVGRADVHVIAGGQAGPAVPCVLDYSRATIDAPPIVVQVAIVEAGCSALDGHWVGTLSGNDPNVSAAVELRMGSDCYSLQGILHWRGRSGASDRLLLGSWDAARRRVAARDTALALDDPSSGWRFCPIDSYELVLSDDGQRLSGSYFSAGCDDRARVELRRDR